MKYMEEYNKEEYIKKRKWSQKEFDDYMQIIENYIKYNDINVQKLRELKKFFNLDTNFWCFIQWVNCYAYALGIDLPYECFNINWYRPGCFYEVIKRTKLEKNQDNYIERLELFFSKYLNFLNSRYIDSISFFMIKCPIIKEEKYTKVEKFSII